MFDAEIFIYLDLILDHQFDRIHCDRMFWKCSTIDLCIRKVWQIVEYQAIHYFVCRTLLKTIKFEIWNKFVFFGYKLNIFYSHTNSWQHLSVKFSPLPFCKAACNSFAVILPERSVSTALNIRSTSGEIPGMPADGGCGA